MAAWFISSLAIRSLRNSQPSRRRRIPPRRRVTRARVLGLDPSLLSDLGRSRPSRVDHERLGPAVDYGRCSSAITLFTGSTQARTTAPSRLATGCGTLPSHRRVGVSKHGLQSRRGLDRFLQRHVATFVLLSTARSFEFAPRSLPSTIHRSIRERVPTPPDSRPSVRDGDDQ